MYDPEKHDRRSIRLKGKDYTEPGSYFITLCVHKREHLFGSIYEGRMILNDFGEIAFKEWEKTEEIRKNIKIDEFIVMPNHLHGIITIKERVGTGTMHRAPTQEAFGKPTSNSIPTIIRSYKAAVTRQINRITKRSGAKIWQRNYYERILRDSIELEAIRKYIRNNPQNWWKDTLKG